MAQAEGRGQQVSCDFRPTAVTFLSVRADRQPSDTYFVFTEFHFIADLPGVAGDPDTHHVFTGPKATDIDKAVSGLGDQLGHGPVLLGWMLGQLMCRGAAGLEASRHYGDVALSGGVSMM